MPRTVVSQAIARAVRFSLLATPPALLACPAIGLAVDWGATPALECFYPWCGAGRRPAGWRGARARAPGTVARHLAEAARLEAASIHAFRILVHELRAELAWELARWFERRLDERSRRRVRTARGAAIAALASSLVGWADASAGSDLGLPSATQAQALFHVLRESIWAA